MHRHSIMQTLASYREQIIPLFASSRNFDPTHERTTVERFFQFIQQNQQCFERTALPGHLTGSALVVDPNMERVALTLHGKLKKWLQFGGHADGCPVIQEVAVREVIEESGLCQLRFHPTTELIRQNENLIVPFDLDVHTIPARPNEPEHQHFDVRFLIIAQDESLIISDESDDLRWFDLEEAKQVASEGSMLRQFAKLEWIKSRQGLNDS